MYCAIACFTNLRTCQVVETILRQNCRARFLLTWIKHWLVPTFFLTGTVGAGVNGLYVVREAEKIQRLTLLIFLVNPSWGHSLPPIHKKWIPASCLEKVRTKCRPIQQQKQETAKLKFMKTQKRPSPISSHLNRTNLVNKGFIKWPKRGLSLAEPQRELNLAGARKKATSRVSPFLAWGDFHARSRFARSTIPEGKWGLLAV